MTILCVFKKNSTRDFDLCEPITQVKINMKLLLKKNLSRGFNFEETLSTNVI